MIASILASPFCKTCNDKIDEFMTDSDPRFQDFILRHFGHDIGFYISAKSIGTELPPELVKTYDSVEWAEHKSDAVVKIDKLELDHMAAFGRPFAYTWSSPQPIALASVDDPPSAGDPPSDPSYTVAADYPENEDPSGLHYLERLWRRPNCKGCGQRRCDPVMSMADGSLVPIPGVCNLCWDPMGRKSKMPQDDDRPEPWMVD